MISLAPAIVDIQYGEESFWIHPTPSCYSCHLFLGQRKGSTAWNNTQTEKDTWLALNGSKAKVCHGHSPISCIHPILGKQCGASLNLHLCLIWQPKLHSGQRMTPWSDAAKQGLTDWGSVYSLQKIASWSWIRNNITFLWSWSWNYPF
jgi:hypothetical protein